MLSSNLEHLDEFDLSKKQLATLDRIAFLLCNGALPRINDSTELSVFRIYSNEELIEKANNKLTLLQTKQVLDPDIEHMITDLMRDAAVIAMKSPRLLEEFMGLRAPIDEAYQWLQKCDSNGIPEERAGIRERLRITLVKGINAYGDIEDKLRFLNVRFQIIRLFLRQLENAVKGPFILLTYKEAAAGCMEITEREWIL